MLQLINYSEKAIAVIGDTKEKATELKKLGGRFNFRLTCGAGWIFPKKAETQLRALIEGKEPEQENPLADARVYVGTYAKYNAGSIAGAWLSLKDYKDKDDFLKACKKLHKDEADPEFMFQDYEGIPSWLIRESWISAEVWAQEPEKQEAGEQSKDEIRAILKRTLPERMQGDLDYYAKNTARLVEAQGQTFKIHKPSIETRFCHADEPEEEVRAWREAVKTYDYFKSENLSDLEQRIERLEKGECNGTLNGLFIYCENYCNLWNWGDNAERYYITSDSKATPMTEETRQALIKGYKAVAKAFEKRLSTWWKRYGADKLHTWTYWRDA